MKAASALLACAWLAACETRLDLGHNASADAGTARGDDDDDSAPPATTPDASAPASTCSDVCSRVIACGILEESNRGECLGRCAGGSTATDRACIMHTSCAAMTATCGIPTDGTPDPDPDPGQDDFDIQVCQDACDSAHFQSCLDATEHADCRTLCSTAAATSRNTFSACIHGGTECTAQADCYAAFTN
jgi:hypothetical protein